MTSPVESPRVPGPHYLVAGRYRLQSRIGGGGMGTVWLARDQLLDREVAVKQVISTQGMSDESAETSRQRAMREGRIAARLSHRNAISMHDVALDDGEPWLVMEYLPSRSVAEVLQVGTVDPAQAAQIGAQVADAMTEAHAVGIVHRDLKPGNILIADAGRNAGLVKITDFGISRAKNDIVLTQADMISGTPAYFAPEVARGEEPDQRSDVFSLGATLYTMVEGQPPFGSDSNTIVLLHRVAQGMINPPARAGALTPVLLRMLEPSPERRPTMAESRELLAEVAAAPGITTHQVLTGLITRPGGRTLQSRSGPTAVRTTPPPRTAPYTGSFSPTAVSGPHQPTSAPHGFAPAPPSHHSQPPHSMMPSPPYPPQRHTSASALALALFGFFVALTIVIVVLIVLLK